MAGNVTLPNLISVARMLLVPVVVYFLTHHRFDLAFLGFAVAGISDGLDGFIARHWNQRSRLGAFLDPLADKLLIVSTFITLGLLGHLPDWLVLMAVARDILIIGGVLLGWILGADAEPRPSLLSKANTLAQILLAAIVLATQGFGWQAGGTIGVLVVATAALTALSGAAYLLTWLKVMTRITGERG